MAPINILGAIKYIPRNAIYHVIRLALEGGSSYNRKVFIPKKRLRLTAAPRQIPVPIHGHAENLLGNRDCKSPILPQLNIPATDLVTHHVLTVL